MDPSSNEPASFLLLLPPPPSSPTINSLKSIYGDTILEVLKEVVSASEKTPQAAILDIALACPHLIGHKTQPRASLFAETQSLLSSLYGLVCLIAKESNTNVEDSEGADVRVLPIAWSPESSQSFTLSPFAFGPILDLPCLAASKRQWHYAFGVETDEGEAFVRAFVGAKQAALNTQFESQAPVSKSTSQSSSEQHSHVAVGGTFDHLHIGHKLLLTMTAFAVDQSQHDFIITIGITGDELLKNKDYAGELESWSARQESVHHFLKQTLDFTAPDAADPVVQEVREPGPNGHVVSIRYPTGLTIRCVEISDPYGPTITDKDISALVVSAETRAGGKAVNDKRSGKGWPALDVLEVDLIKSNEAAEKISSTAIRKKQAGKSHLHAGHSHEGHAGHSQEGHAGHSHEGHSHA